MVVEFVIGVPGSMVVPVSIERGISDHKSAVTFRPIASVVGKVEAGNESERVH